VTCPIATRPPGHHAYAQVFDPYWIQTQFETIQSKSILHQVITNLNLNKIWGEKLKFERDLRTDESYALLKRMVDVRQSRMTSLIEIRVYSEDKFEAAKLANKIAEVYRDSRLALRKESSGRGIKTLEEESQKQEAAVSNMQARVDTLKIELKISDSEAQTYGMMTTPEPEILRKLEGQRIEARAEFTKIDNLYSNLTNMTRVEFKKAVAVASPDLQLNELSVQQASAEPDHPLLPIDHRQHPVRALKIRRSRPYGRS
jgi:hypothetical protein